MVQNPKQLVILSGKGGTGKTSLAAGFAHLASLVSSTVKVVLADADVDAANLELLLAPQILERHDFWGGKVAVINQTSCINGGDCADICRFDAIYPSSFGGLYRIDPIACDGCAACVYQCPTRSIRMEAQISGQWFHSNSLYGPLFHAALIPAQENSGKLVTLVKQNARLLAMDEVYNMVLVDGPPGIGCPVISATSGADLALIVTEPTAMGIHDMERVLQTTNHFDVKALVCINKADIYPQGTAEIESFCREQGIQVVGQIPFDLAVTKAMVQGQTVTVYDSDAPASRAIKDIWEKVKDFLFVELS